jgi:hypothetical protein
MSCRVIFGGMPSAGKSTLVCSLGEILRRRGHDVALHELDIWSDTHACILGEKPWEERAKRGGNSKEQDDLHPEFAAAVERFRTDPAQIVFGDLPGCTNESWHTVAGSADHAVLVYRSPIDKDEDAFYANRRVIDWEQQMSEWEIPVIGRVQSVQAGSNGVAGTERFLVSGLDRELVLDDSGLLNLASLLGRFAESTEPQLV